MAGANPTTTLPRRKLTEAAVARIKPPADGRLQIPDAHAAGLWLRITDRGARTWSVLYRANGGPVRRVTLGRWPAVGVAAARQLAREALATAAKGQDPALLKRDQRQGGDLFETVAGEWVERHAKRRQRRWQETEATICRYLLPVWAGRRVGAIGRADVLRVIDPIADRGHGRQANKVLALTRQILAWAEHRGLVERNVAAGVPKPHAERSRDRVLDDDELAAVWRAAGEMGWPWAPFVRLLVLLGQRRNEIASMRWADLDLDGGRWRIPAEQTKMNRARDLPLPGAAVELIASLPRIAGSALVFPAARAGSPRPISGFSKMKRRLDELSGVRDWRLHDLRRSTATGLQRLGVRLEVTEAVLGHVAGSRAGVIGVYQRHEYGPEQRVALERWAGHVARLVDGGSAKVVRLAPHA